jgi:hypothetical protein
MTAVAGFGFVGTIERKTYHKEEKRSRERSGQGVCEKLMDGLAIEDTTLQFAVEEARRNNDGSMIGENKRMRVGYVLGAALLDLLNSLEMRGSLTGCEPLSLSFLLYDFQGAATAGLG